MSKYIAPICLFVYNRPRHTKQTVETLAKNKLASQSDLFIFSDGPKNKEDEKKIAEVRKFIKTITGFKNVTIVEREANLGLAESIINGVTEIVNKFNKIIVLEDDLITSPYFLEYMNDGLNLYEKNDQVISIHGYIYPVKKTFPETFFLKNPSCWGWATWKRGWDLFEPDGKKLLNELNQKNLTKEFDFNNSFHYTEMLKKQIAELNNSWAIRWYASAFLKNKLTLYPCRSLINNTGFDGSGTHSNKTEVYKSGVTDTPVVVGKIDIKENAMARQEITRYFKSMKPKMIKRIYWKIKNLIPIAIKIWILNFLPNIQKEVQIIIGRTRRINVVTPNPKMPNYYMFKNKFNTNSVVIDAGCGFDADFSMYMIKNYHIKAIGIDPTLKHKESLEKLVKEKSGKFVHKAIAISKENGKIMFNESVSSVSGSILEEHINIKNKQVDKYEVESVNLASLPEYLGLSKIDYIKLDLEGSEYNLIENLKKDDLEKYDQIFIEFHHHALPQYSKQDTIKSVEKIESFGFKSFSIDKHDFIFYR